MTLKRVVDLSFSSIALILLVPFFVLIASLVFIKFGHPIIFKQLRPGLNCKPFKMVKFRTMTDKCDTDGNLLPDSVRLTSFGRFLRSTSLDELPGLWNVFKGEMSLVGPRPLLMQYLERYNEHQVRRHNVRPGITGLAQVIGRNSLSWDEKFALDLWYVEHHSLIIDVKILLMTVVKVFKRDGISAPSEATMSEFLGAESQDAWGRK